MAEYVNNVIKGEEQREIHDKRVPEVTVEDAGKVLKVGEEGNYELGEAGGGTKLYRHQISIPCSWTYEGQQHTEAVVFEVISTVATSLNDLTNMYYVLQAMNFRATSRFNTTSRTMEIHIYCGYGIVLTNTSSLNPNSFANRLAFNNSTATFFSEVRPGASLSAYTYGPDTIDLSTGEMKERVNLISDFSADMANSTDTIVAL